MATARTARAFHEMSGLADTYRPRSARERLNAFLVRRGLLLGTLLVMAGFALLDLPRPTWLLIELFVVPTLALLLWTLADNFHAVVPGVFYRSRQLSGARLQVRIRRHGLRCVINLRGSNVAEHWYHEERQTSARLGVLHHNLLLRARFAPTADQLRALIDLFDSCPKPVMVHCRSGVDRSGLAAAVYLLLNGNVPAQEAERHLSWRFGHLPWRRMRPFAGVLKQYRQWLKQKGCTHNAEHFRHWAQHVYMRAAKVG